MTDLVTMATGTALSTQNELEMNSEIDSEMNRR